MNDLRCRPGDLAVVIDAATPVNLGRIVKVIEAHHGKDELHYAADRNAWLVECSHPLVWFVGERRICRKSGPVPDDQLQPIRAYPLGQDIAELVTVSSQI